MSKPKFPEITTINMGHGDSASILLGVFTILGNLLLLFYLAIIGGFI